MNSRTLIGSLFVVGLVSFGAIFAILSIRTDENVDTNASAGFDRADLLELNADKRFPVYMPVEMPSNGTQQDNFLLSPPAVNDDGPSAGLNWTTTYSPDLLPAQSGDVAGYAVLQVGPSDGEPTEYRRCANATSSGGEQITRQVEDVLLTICLGPRPTVEARDYWQQVEFTNDPELIAWLPRGE